MVGAWENRRGFAVGKLIAPISVPLQPFHSTKHSTINTTNKCQKSATMEPPIQLSFPLPRSLDTRIYLNLTVKAKAIMLFLTSASAEEAAAPTPLGSFVYALPDVWLLRPEVRRP